MQVNISTRHGHIGAQTQAKINEKVMKLTRFHDRLTHCEITVDLENEERPSLEINVTAEKAGPFVASEAGEQLMGLVDSVVHKLEQQLRKHKEKSNDRNRGNGKRAAANVETADEE